MIFNTKIYVFSDNSCMICPNDKCNINIFIEDQQSDKNLNFNAFNDEVVKESMQSVESQHQRSCLSGSMVLSKPKLCRIHNDQCIIFVSDGIPSRRGCLHDFVDEPIPGIDILSECNKPSITCEKCYSDDCNKRFVGGSDCIACDSKENSKCSSASTFVETSFHKFCPVSIRKLGCFHYLNGDHHIRGLN